MGYEPMPGIDANAPPPPMAPLNDEALLLLAPLPPPLTLEPPFRPPGCDEPEPVGLTLEPPFAVADFICASARDSNPYAPYPPETSPGCAMACGGIM